MTTTGLVILDFDGTLFTRSQEAMKNSVQLTVHHFIPTQTLTPADLRPLVTSGIGLSDIFQILYPNTTTFTEDDWIAKYREFYAEQCQPLIETFPGAKQVLEYLRSHHIPTAIVSNKGVAVVKAALEKNGLEGYVLDDFILGGDNTPGGQRKPGPKSFIDVLAPAVRAHYGEHELDLDKVLIVGDTVVDMQYARNIGGKACWCRYGYGDQAKCLDLKPDFIIDSLGEVVNFITTLGL